MHACPHAQGVRPDVGSTEREEGADDDDDEDDDEEEEEAEEAQHNEEQVRSHAHIHVCLHTCPQRRTHKHLGPKP